NEEPGGRRVRGDSHPIRSQIPDPDLATFVVHDRKPRTIVREQYIPAARKLSDLAAGVDVDKTASHACVEAWKKPCEPSRSDGLPCFKDSQVSAVRRHEGGYTTVV